LTGSIDRRNAPAVEFDLPAAMDLRQSSLDVSLDSCSDAGRIVENQLIGDAYRDPLFSAMDRPNECAIGSIKLLDPRLLFDHLGTVHA
jgi:hypothetical protein